MSQLPNPNPKISRKEAVDQLWRKGVLHWKLHPAQRDIHNLVQTSKEKIIVVGASRQLGKTWALTVIALEHCLQTPNIIVKFIAPKAKDIRRILAPAIKEITSDCPKDLKPSFNSRENIYVFPNGSEIQLAGTDNGHAESIRGNRAHLCIIDEAGFCDELEYVVKSILLPTMTRTNGKLVMISTPSKSPDHPFMTFFDQAEARGTLVKKTIYDNPHLTQQQIDDIAEALGGKDSVDFRREYLVERIISETDAVVPEFGNEDLRTKIILEWNKPPFFDSYVSMDIGGKDLTVVVFAYYDFARAKLIIEDEYVASGQVLTDEIARNVANKEKALWGEKPPYLRVSDNNNIILLNDLSVKHGLTFMPTLKDNADAALNNMRMLLRSERIIINPKCKTLITHLRGAIWNKAKTDYSRNTTEGHHYDMVDALSYLCRNVNFNKNPYPPGFMVGDPNTFFSDPRLKVNKPAVEEHLEKMFKVKKARGIGRY